jgi:RimJ/RimL family protein N-acetyltransferase
MLSRPSPPLADEVIRLEPLDERHVRGFELLIADPDVVRNTRVPSTPEAGFASKWLGRYVDGWSEGSRAGFAILSDADAFLGFVGIVDLDLGRRQGEIGYVVSRDARGRGIAGRALRLVTDWAFGDLALERVELHIDPGNEASIRVAERVGYVREGILRSVHFKEDIRNDIAIYSLLRGDPR